MSRRIIVPGGSGFIGSALSKMLHQNGYSVVILSRSAKHVAGGEGSDVKIAHWDGKTGDGWAEYAEDAYAIVNLAGENIGSFWTKSKKEKILQSRINAGNAIIDALRRVKNKPKVLVQVSGIGYYGNSGDSIIDEHSAVGKGYLPDIAKLWEGSVKEVQSMGVRLVIARFGIVLGGNGGFLSRVMLPFKFYIGGHFGNGRQWMPWIHINDVAGALQFLIENSEADGVFNICSPNPERGKEFFKIMGKVMNRPSFLHIPGFVLRMAMGEMAKELILGGQRAMPGRLLDDEYSFLYTRLEDAFKNIFNKNEMWKS